MRFFVALAGIVVSLAAACSRPVPPVAPKTDLSAEQEAIRANRVALARADARWLKAAQARDAVAEAAMFANDGVAYREHVDPLIGPQAYEAYESNLYMDNPKLNVTWSTSAVRLAEAGDLAIQTGEYAISGIGPKGDDEDKGRFVTVWKKFDGEWKVATDIRSTTMPDLSAISRDKAIELAQSQTKKLSDEEAMDLLFERIVADRPYADSLECIFLMKDGSSTMHFEAGVFEKHNDKCGGDPNFAPRRDAFRVSRNGGKIEWWDWAKDSWQPYKDFLAFRRHKD